MKLAVHRATFDLIDMIDHACAVSDAIERRGSVGPVLPRRELCCAVCESSACVTKYCYHTHLV